MHVLVLYLPLLVHFLLLMFWCTVKPSEYSVVPSYMDKYLSPYRAQRGCDMYEYKVSSKQSLMKHQVLKRQY